MSDGSFESPRGQNWIVHLCQSADWQAALKMGYYQADSLAEVGFIHCSRPEQVAGVANRYYVGYTDLVLLWIDPDRLQAELRWEAADKDLYPHIYGSLNLNAVQAVVAFPAASDGHFYTDPAFPG
jgi:uncharacterized protein (DUF952 family)